MHKRELRLALVCYGGISLAVYMHGITREVWHLARASRAVHDGAATTGVEAVYARLLAEVEERGEARLRVLPDIVAGASAGGINGIFLAQAVATGQSLEPLTDLWLASADVEVLIDPDAAPHSRFSKVWALPLAWMAAGRSGGEVEALDPDTRDEVRAKLSHFIRSRWFEPPFGGAVFTRLLVDAFEAMAAAPRGLRLLPDGQPLDLFVTVTDFTGHPERLRLNSPPEVVETEHRLVIAFSHEGGDAAADGLAPLPELVFAARATSSFPGAFPPFTVAELDAVLAERRLAWPERRDFLHRILPRQAAAGAAERAVLIDGSVLANAPFRPAIEALAQRPARRQVDRRFVYIDPAPGMKFRVGGGGSAVPGFFQTILGAISELPRQQPIRDNLEAIAARSDRIDRLRAIVEAVRPRVDAAVEQLFGRTLFLDRPTPARLVAWRKRAHAAAEADAGIAYAAYDRVKREGVVDLLAELAGGHDAVRRRALRTALAAAIGDDPVEPLRRFDARFRIRRLRLLARRLADLEGEHPEAAIAPVRTAIYGALSGYLDVCRGEMHHGLGRLARATRRDAAPLVAALDAALDLHRLDAATDEALAAALAEAPREVRRPILLAYLGFLYFDVATMPLLQGEGLDEFDPIRVDRIAPDDAASIRPGGAEATLKGIQFNNFGAFFSRAYRENDYLWGRLHGAERMIDIVVSTLPATARMKPGRVAALKRDAFRAILDEEEDRLTAVPGLVADLRREVG